MISNIIHYHNFKLYQDHMLVLLRIQFTVNKQIIAILFSKLIYTLNLQYKNIISYLLIYTHIPGLATWKHNQIIMVGYLHETQLKIHNQ